jgi:hypothetical protein
MMGRIRVCCRSATFVAVLAGAAPICNPPVAPFMPESDAAFKEYADLINQDFERYFTEISRYSACLDQARAELMVEAQAVSKLHKEFLARVEALGVARKAAIPTE